MGFVQKIDPLYAHIVVCLANDRFRRKLLNIHHSNGILTCIVGCSNGSDILNELLFGIHLFHMEPASSKFFSCLGQQVQAINDKIELRNLSLTLIVVSQIPHIMESQGGLPAPLGVPNDTMFNSRIQFLFNGKRREKLWVSHDMFLQGLNAVLIGTLHISKAIFQKLQKTARQKQRGQHSIGRR